MAEDNSQSPQKKESAQSKSEKGRIENLKNDPRLQSTHNFFMKYLVETLYVVAIVIATLYSMVSGPYWGVFFTGVGFIVGLILYPMMKDLVGGIGSFFKKQDMVVQIIIAAVVIILAFFIHAIVLGVMVGIPSGICIRKGIVEMKKRNGGE